MRYVQGTDLATLLEQEGPLEPARALELVDQVADALDAAHEHDLVQRDVKPANVLVTEEGGEEHCYLADFGLARTADLEAGPASGAHLSGTVDYTAPEQIAAEPADRRADVYSLGCVLYECLAGEPPFKRPRAMATLFAHASEPPPSLQQRRPELPERIDQVIARALAKEPEERYTTCRELCDEARDALGLGAPRLSRRQLLFAGIGAALALAAAGTVPAVILTRRDRAAAPLPAILPVTGDSLVRIDPATGVGVAAIPVGDRPFGVAVGEGAVWVVDPVERTLARIDPNRNTVVDTVSLSGNSPEQVAAGEGAVWISAVAPDHSTGRILRYDPATGSLASTAIELANDVTVGLDTVLASDDAGNFYWLDPTTGAIASSFADLGESWLAFGEGAFWAAASPWVRPERAIRRIDPATRAITETGEVGHAFNGIAAGEGAVWAVSEEDGVAVRIDPATLQVTDTVPVRWPSAVAASGGAAWVTSYRDGTVIRIDPVTVRASFIEVGGNPTGVAVGEGAVWVTVSVG